MNPLFRRTGARGGAHSRHWQRLQTGSILIAFVLVLGVFTAGATRAQDGYFDQDWGVGGRQLLDLGQLDDLGVTLKLQRDGKLVLAGHCGEVQATYAFCATRLRPDGQLDLTFGPSETGRFLGTDEPGFPPFNNIGIHGLALRPDGHVVMGGWGSFHCGNGVSCNVAMLVHLDASGHVVPTSNGSPYTSATFTYNDDENSRHDAITAVAATPDGKIVVAGDSTRSDSEPANRDFGIARFNADLSPDAGFDGGGRRLGAFDLGDDHFDAARAIAVQADGRIVVGGYARGTDGRWKAALMRLNADGSTDQGFGNGGRVWFDGLQNSPGNIFINAVAIDRRGRIVVAGARQIWDGTDHDFFVSRVGPTGQLETSFGGSGNGVVSIAFDIASPAVDQAWDVLVQGDGKILVVGSASYDSTHYAFAVTRLHDSGQRDLGFGNDGKALGTFAPVSEGGVRSDVAYSAALGNGGLMVAGNGLAQGGDIRFGIARLQIDAIFADGLEP
jgi:uncharacterized delta-60 repeat protein